MVDDSRDARLAKLTDVQRRKLAQVLAKAEDRELERWLLAEFTPPACGVLIIRPDGSTATHGDGQLTELRGPRKPDEPTPAPTTEWRPPVPHVRMAPEPRA